MRATRGFAGFLDALCLIWLTKQTVVSGQLTAPAVVTAAYGGSVTVHCQYDSQYRQRTKYWCRGSAHNFCSIVVETARNRIRDRTFIADNKAMRVFTVTVNSLRYEDDDVYWCIIDSRGRKIHTRVRLSVSQGWISHLVSTVTPSSSTLTCDEISWWAILRWILFTLMLCCLISTHIFVWWTQTAKRSTSTAAISPKMT